MSYFFGVCMIIIVIMQTPWSTPPKTPQGTPKRNPPSTPGSPISCHGILFPERGGICKAESPAKSPLPQTRKPQKKRSDSQVYFWLPLLKRMILEFTSRIIGKGDFGTVSEVRLLNPPGTPQSTPIAVKDVSFHTRGVFPRDLRDEVGRLGSPGCVRGVACRTEESMQILMPLGIPFESLDFSKMTSEILEWVILSVKEICMKVDFGVAADIKPENLILIPKGTATVIKDSEGQPCIGPVTGYDEIVLCDLGSVDPTSGGTKKYGVLPLVESDAEKADFQTKLRTFKADMMEALIRDAAKPSGETVEQIVARCVPKGLAYANSVKQE